VAEEIVTLPPPGKRLQLGGDERRCGYHLDTSSTG
jgi:hypothetical protein